MREQWPGVEKLPAVDRLPLVGRAVGGVALARQRKGRRTEAEQVHQQRFVVAGPGIREEARLGSPAVGDRRAADEHPLPVRPTVEFVRQPADLGLLLGIRVEVGGTGEHPGEEECRVDRRELALPDAPTGLHVEEVVVETLVARCIRLRPLRAVAKEAQCLQRDRGRELAGDHAAFDEHRDGRQSEAHGGDAARSAGIGLVADQAVGRVGLVQVVLERRQLKLVQLLLGRNAVQCCNVVSHEASPSSSASPPSGARRPSSRRAPSGCPRASWSQ